MGNYFIKATLENGISQNTPAITYKVGKVVHPNPDRESDSPCGRGIHLAKSIRSAREYVPKATEFYLAKPGTILGEDDKKVRCDSCQIIKRLSDATVKRMANQELKAEDRHRKAEDRHRKELAKEAEMRKHYGKAYDTGGLPGRKWFQAHCADVTMEDVNNQTITIFRDNKKVMSLKPSVAKKDIRFALKTLAREST